MGHTTCYSVFRENRRIKEMAHKKILDKEMILGCGIVALLEYVSVIFAMVLYIGWDITRCDSTIIFTSFFVLAGSIWGILLCRNC